MPKPQKFHGRLSGRVAIVTGAGSEEGSVGIGTAIAYVLAREGARVCLMDLDAGRAEIARRMIAGDGGEACTVSGDVAFGADCARAVATTVERYGRLDILVNNVGITVGAERIEALDEELWDRVQNVNLKSAALMSKHTVPHLIAAGGGSIVNVTSIAALLASGGAYAYASSKAGMIALTREVAVMYGRQGIRANAVAPGHMFTPIVEKFFDDKAKAARRKVAPLGVEGDAWDIAQAVLFFASDESRFVTGVCLPVDGGVTTIMPIAAHAQIES